VMRPVAGRWAWATVSVGSEVGTALNSALGHQFIRHVAGSYRRKLVTAGIGKAAYRGGA
jgi:hypothetical protein